MTFRRMPDRIHNLWSSVSELDKQTSVNGYVLASTGILAIASLYLWGYPVGPLDSYRQYLSQLLILSSATFTGEVIRVALLRWYLVVIRKKPHKVHINPDFTTEFGIGFVVTTAYILSSAYAVGFDTPIRAFLFFLIITTAIVALAVRETPRNVASLFFIISVILLILISIAETTLLVVVQLTMGQLVAFLLIYTSIILMALLYEKYLYRQPDITQEQKRAQHRIAGSISVDQQDSE